jgi:hypothetical protein
MPREYILHDLGIEMPLNLEGDLRILRAEKGLPIVFLFDEHHGDLNSCIDKNIENAIELIDKGNIVIVGVESHTGGKEWNSDDKSYIEYGGSEKDYINRIIGNPTKFFDGLSSNEFVNLVKGVECEAFSDELAEYKGNLPFIEIPINITRTKHFIRTLFELREQLNSSGNLILNCGRDHNTHIAEWIDNGEIDNIAGFRANYIRINTIGSKV